ncbi:MAG: SGNH/GDSL hydrolase family protein [Pseudomonadota bacterium]
MSRPRVLAWWAAALLLAPIWLPQALRTRRTALRLPPAAGSIEGVVGGGWPGTPLRLLLLGESTVVGVGVEHLQQALPVQLAEALAQRLGRPVHWRACGENGITALQARTRLLPRVLDAPVELAVLVFGVNDSTGLTGLAAWDRALSAMAEALTAQGARVAFTAVPPLQHFAALPGLLRRLLGARATLLDARLNQLAARLGLAHCAVSLGFSADYLARDGYHPSELGYRVWAEGLAALLIPASPPVGI